MRWTPELDAKVKIGRACGLSSSEIAAQIGTTRNAVIGRAFRLGMSEPYDVNFCRQRNKTLKKLRSQGLKLREIGELYGLTVSGVWRAINAT